MSNMKRSSLVYDRHNITLDIPAANHHCSQCGSCVKHALKSHYNKYAQYMVDRSLSDEDLHKFNGVQTDERSLNYLARSKRSTSK